MNKSETKNTLADRQARRRILKTAVLGSAAAVAIPEKWAKPVVNSVMLPAHATTTGNQIETRVLNKRRNLMAQFKLPKNSVVKPGNQIETLPNDLLQTGGTGYLVADESFPNIVLPADVLAAEQEAAQAMNLSDILIPSAHATDLPDLVLNFTTRYYIRNNGGGNFQFTMLRIFETGFHRWFAAGNLTEGATVGIPTYKDCGLRSYEKQVELKPVTATHATIIIKVGPLNYTKVIPFVDGASPDVC